MSVRELICEVKASDTNQFGLNVSVSSLLYIL